MRGTRTLASNCTMTGRSSSRRLALILSSINSRTCSSTKVTFCLESNTMRRRSGMTERGCREEFNTRTGINGFPSSLSEPIPTADSEVKREAGKGEGKIHTPSASNAVCDDDYADKNPLVLHVQGGLAEQGVYHLQTV